jgi:hypothetical protein
MVGEVPEEERREGMAGGALPLLLRPPGQVEVEDIGEVIPIQCQQDLVDEVDEVEGTSPVGIGISTGRIGGYLLPDEASLLPQGAAEAGEIAVGVEEGISVPARGHAHRRGGETRDMIDRH